MPYEQGIFIDVFPLDGVPDNYILRSIKNFECFCVRKVLWSTVGKIADKSKFKRVWFGLLDKIPAETVFHYYCGMIRRANKKEIEMVRILMFPTPNKEWGYYKRWYEESQDTVFEGIVFQGIKEYDEYLKFKFGEYMELPPEEKRKVHPVSDLKI